MSRPGAPPNRFIVCLNTPDSSMMIDWPCEARVAYFSVGVVKGSSAELEWQELV
jgi:hypothetical protein